MFEWKKACNNSACVEVGAEWVSGSGSTGNCVEAAWTRSSTTTSCVEAAWAQANMCHNGECVEVQHSGACHAGECVEVTHEPDCPWVHVRDSKDPDGTVLVWPRSEWNGGEVLDFIAVNSRKADDELRQVAIDRKHDPAAQWYMVLGVTEGGQAGALFFDQAEVDAFAAGVKARTFALA